MDAALHSIEGRNRSNEVEPAAFAHFQLGPARPVASQVAVAEPGWSLYCLDCEARKALFVELAPEVDLSGAVFVNPLQFREARRALVVPFEALAGLADQIAAPERLIVVFNIGRSGTTLVNAMLNEIEGVWSLSEPDAYFDMVMKRALFERTEALGLVKSCTRLLFRPRAGTRPHTMALKLRAEGLFRADLFHAAFPEAACVFLYRDGESWARSFHHFMRKLGVPPVLDRDDRKFIWWIMSAGADVSALDGFVDMEADQIYPEELLAPAWAYDMQEYFRQLALGVPFLAIRYDELNANREAVVARLLQHCGLPAGALPAALHAFERDSQAGTAIARGHDEETFTADNVARFRATLARHPTIRSPDLVLPDVYGGGSVI